MEHDRENEYRRREKHFREKARSLKQKLDRIVGLRVILFGAGVAGVAALFQLGTLPGILGLIGFLVIFLSMVRFHGNVQYEYRFAKARAEVCEEGMTALQGDHTPFDDGREFIDPEHDHSYDLDLFGEGGVFPLLDRTSTYQGKKNLVGRLLKPDEKAERILKVQEAVHELSGKTDLRESLRARGKLFRDQGQEEERLIGKLSREAPVPLLGSIGKVLRYIVPAMSVALFFFLLMGMITFGQYLLFLVLPFGLVGWKMPAIRRRFGAIEAYVAVIKGHAGILEDLEQEDLRSEELRKLKERVVARGGKASQRILRLQKIADAFESRNNPFVGLALNALLLWDWQCAFRLEKFLEEERDNMHSWFEVVGELDALSSLATYAYEHPYHVFPVPGQEGPLFEAVELGHPMIAPGERVNNNLELLDIGQFQIITGANMAGKSTFLRSVGVALVLGMAGTVVCAEALRFRPVRLITSMRTSDSLASHESFFFSELKRLQRIVAHLENGGTCFILLDEILKGTNSDDKKAGSRDFLRKLMRYQAGGIVATHDLDLTVLAKEYPDRIGNLRFEAEIRKEGLHFDYRLREGVCRNMNATYLMREMGITDKQEE